MKDGLFLGVLCLSGWLAFATRLPRQYHYVSQTMNWTDAQSFCRESFTDLATAESTEEINQLVNSMPSGHRSSVVWIGLYHEIKWRWSDGYEGSGKDYKDWDNNGHNLDFYAARELCVLMRYGGGWYDIPCAEYRKFICYNGSMSDPNYVLVNELMSWSSAQSYCRDKFTDLATVRNATEAIAVQSFLPTSQTAWIGLFRDPPMYWSDGSGYSFSHWASVDNPVRSPNVMLCAVADLQNSGTWRLSPCQTYRPFVCYSILPVVKKQIIKLRLKSSADLHDAAVRADILKKLQDKANEGGLSGVTLKWSKQPERETVHKEEKPEKKTKNRTLGLKSAGP